LVGGVYKLNLDRLAKTLGMMDSVHDGEALAAARSAVKQIRDAGATWFDVVRPEPPRPPQNDLFRNSGWNPEPEDDHRVVAQMILDWHESRGLFLYEREPDFLDTVRHWHGDLTEAQQSWFDKIVLRARRKGFPV